MDIKKDVQKQFGRSADEYVKSSGHRKGADLQKLVEIARVTGLNMSLMSQLEEDIQQTLLRLLSTK